MRSSILPFVIAHRYITHSTVNELLECFQGDRLGIGGESVAMTEPSEPIDGGENGGQKVWDDEDEAVAYNYRYAFRKPHLSDI